MSEVRTFLEGALWFVQASATGGGFITAATPPSGLIGYVQAGTNSTSAQNIATIMERGTPDHHKLASKEAPEVTFTFLEAVTAKNPVNAFGTAGGASLPLVHFELKQAVPESANITGRFWRWHHCALVTDNWTDAEEGNTKNQTWRALSTLGPTASGYLS